MNVFNLSHNLITKPNFNTPYPLKNAQYRYNVYKYFKHHLNDNTDDCIEAIAYMVRMDPDYYSYLISRVLSMSRPVSEEVLKAASMLALVMLDDIYTIHPDFLYHGTNSITIKTPRIVWDDEEFGIPEEDEWFYLHLEFFDTEELETPHGKQSYYNQVIRQIQTALEQQKEDYLHLPIAMFPVIRTCYTVPDSNYLGSVIWDHNIHVAPVIAFFRRVRSFDEKRLTMSGDVELNPGPNVRMPPEHLRGRVINAMEPPMINPHSPVNMEKKVADVVPANRLMENLLTHMYKTPIPSSFVKHHNLTLIQTNVINLAVTKINKSDLLEVDTHWNVSRYTRGPVTVVTTPLETALELLCEASGKNNTQYSVPIYITREQVKKYHTINHVYHRRDGKKIVVFIHLSDLRLYKPIHSYVSITDVKLVAKEYMSFCISKYYEYELEKSFKNGNRAFIRHNMLSMFNFNPLIANLLESCPENFFCVRLFAPEASFPLAQILNLEPTPESNRMLAVTKAPLGGDSFRRWLNANRELLSLNINYDFLNLRFNQFGLGAALSYGTFMHKSTHPIAAYITTIKVWKPELTYPEEVLRHVGRVLLSILLDKDQRDWRQYLDDDPNSIFAVMHVLRIGVLNGVARQPVTLCSKRVLVCPMCHGMFKNLNFEMEHCLKKTPAYQQLNKEFMAFEGVFNYWFQKVLNLEKPTFNAFLYYCQADNFKSRLVDLLFDMKSTTPTMFSAYSNFKQISNETPVVVNEIKQQLSETRGILDQFKEKDLLNRADRVLKIFEPSELPDVNVIDGLGEFTSFIDSMVSIKTMDFVRCLFPLFDPKYFPHISITKIIRDYILMKHIDNKVVKGFVLVDLLHQAGLFNAISVFFGGFQIIMKEQMATAWSDVTDWINHFLSKPAEWINSLSGFVGGFVASMLGSCKNFDASHLYKFLAKMTSPVRSLSQLASGFGAINTIFTFISKAYYLAKEYVYTSLGKKCTVPIFVHLREHMTTWASAVTTLMLPCYRNTILNTPESWKLIDDISDIGFRLLAESKGNGLNSTVAGLQKDLFRLRSQISLKRGIRQSTIVPFVIHLDGPPKIGKSAMVMRIIEVVCKVLGLPMDIYMYNEMLKFMDGYGGQSVLVCDDTNLCKSFENVAWLIKTVSPNLCTLSTAINEERPLISNIKLIILTSNVAYSPISDAATTKGIDRRSSHKFSVTAKHYKQDQTKIDTSAADFDWQTEHTFERIPSVAGDKLAPEDEFKGGMTDFLEYITREAVEHIKAEKERVLKSPQGFFEPLCNDELMKILLDGVVPGNDELNLEEIREELSKIQFITSETFLHRPTVLTTEEENALANAITTTMRVSPERVRLRALNVTDYGRIVNVYPILADNIIQYLGPIEEPNPVNLVQTTYLYNRPFVFENIELDFYFLHHLESGFTYSTPYYYKRNDFTSNNITLLPTPSTLDYEALQSLRHDVSFMASWRLFFAQSDSIREKIYSSYKIRMNTVTHLTNARSQWFTRFSNFFSNLFSQDNLHKLLITSLIGMTTIASVAMAYEAASAILCYENEKKYSERLWGEEQFGTSQAGKQKPVMKKTGVAQVLTSASSHQNYSDIKTKVIKNVYLAKLPDYTTKIVGTFNILFITERYALVPHHSVNGLLPLENPRDRDMCALDIYSSHHQRWIRYYFNRHYYRFPNQDAVLIHIPAFQAQSNIIPLFMKQAIDDQYSGSTTEIVYRNPSNPNMLETHSGKNICHNDIVRMNIQGKDFNYDDEYCSNMSVVPGSSGAPHFFDNNKFQTKVMGIQSSSGWDNCFVVRLTQDRLEEAIKYYNDILPIIVPVDAGVPTCDVPFTHCYDSNIPSLIGTVEPKYSVSISPKTQLKRTPWYNELIPPPTKTPVLSRVSLEDRYLYVNKTERTQPIPFDQSALDRTVDEYSDYLRAVLRSEYGNVFPSILSLHKVLNGNYIGGKPIDLSTSPGIGMGDWIHTREQPGQNDFVYRENDVFYPTTKLTTAVSTLLSNLVAGRITTSTYASFPKDELRNKDARGIDGAPIEQKEVYKMLCGTLDGMLSAMNRGQLKYGLGIDLFSANGVKLISRMTPLIMMWDFSNYDGSITLQMYEAAARIYNNLSGNDEYSIARLALARSTCQSTIIADNKVYQPLKGMRSGFGGTSSWNTHIHNLFLIMALKNILKAHVQNPTLNDIFSIVDWITFGDDGLSWLLDPDYAEHINGETISLQFQDFGLIVSDPRGKSSLPPKFVNIEEATFLKQSPYWDDVINLPLWRVGEECLQSVFSYFSGDDPTEPLDCAFRMLWPYGRQRYEDYRRKLNNILEKSKCKFVHDWFDFRDAFLQHFDGVSYTGRLYGSSRVGFRPLE